ncbi:MAG: PAS domain S-box protein [Acidobacteriota bacterium]
MSTFKRLLIQTITLPLILVTTLALILFWQINTLLSLSEWSNRANKVIAEANSTHKLLLDVQTGLRGYLLTGAPVFLHPTNQARQQIDSSFNALAVAVSDNDLQLRRLQAIRKDFEQWNRLSQELIEMRRQGGAYQSYENNWRGEEVMDYMRNNFTLFIQSEEALRDELNSSTQQATRRTTATVWGLTLCLGGALAWFTRRQMIRVSHTYRNALDMAKQQTETVRENKEEFRLMALNASDLLYIRTLPSNQITWFGNLDKMLGYEAGGISATSQRRRLIHPEDRQRVVEAYARSLRIGEPFNEEYRICHKNGNYLFFLDRGLPIRDSNGKLTKFIGACTDITLHKQSEERLRAQGEFLRQVIDTSPNLIWVKDGTGNYVLANRALAELYGTTVDGIIGKRESDLNTDAQAVEDSLAIDREVVSTQTPTVIDEQKVTNAANQSRWLQVIKVPLLTSSGTIQVLGVATDVTERRRLEQQLRQSQKVEAIGRLAGGIAHDFNNILAAIIGYDELAATALPATHGVQEYLKQIHKAGDRATQLVRQILTFSRQQEQERRPTSLQAVIKESFELLRPSIPATIEIRLEIDAEVPTVLADATQIHQIMMNLGTNALHAMNEQGGVLAIRLTTFYADAAFTRSNIGFQEGHYVRLVVSDTGHGMDQATVERIFEPFFTTKDQSKGTGLGLSVVHGIVKKHEGRILVYSEPGKGTAFNIYFPALAGDCVTLQENKYPIRRGDGERILFVDDEQPLIRIGKEILEGQGYAVVTESCGHEALETFRAKPHLFDLVITDFTMPGMDGCELAKHLLQFRPDLPIILVTGYNPTITPEKAQTVGIREIVMKPVTRQLLGAAVSRALEK